MYNILDETKRMKDLLGYKRGRVISEQNYGRLNESEDDGKKEYLADQSWKTKQPECSHGLRQCLTNYNDYGNARCDFIWDGYESTYVQESWWTEKFGTKVPEEVKDPSSNCQTMMSNKPIASQNDGKNKTPDNTGKAEYVADQTWKGTKLDCSHGLRMCVTNYNDYGNAPCNYIWDGQLKNYFPEEWWTEKFGTKVPDEVYDPESNCSKMIKNTPSTNNQGNQQGSTNNTNQGSFTLDTVEKIRAFQDWMDETFGAWANSVKNPGTKYMVKQKQNRGWGTFGPETKKAWEKYKDRYLKEKNLNSTNSTNQSDDDFGTGDAPTPAANTGGLGVPDNQGGEYYTSPNEDF